MFYFRKAFISHLNTEIIPKYVLVEQYTKQILSNIRRKKWDQALLLCEESKLFNFAFDDSVAFLQLYMLKFVFQREDLFKSEIAKLRNENALNNKTEIQIINAIEKIEMLQNASNYSDKETFSILKKSCELFTKKK